MELNTYHLYTHSILHCGSGQALGSVDLPIARDSASHFPIAPGSSLRGVLRNAISRQNSAVVEHLFGRSYAGAHGESAAGALSIGDAHLLVLPVRALQGIVAYISCPFILKRYQRDRQCGYAVPEVALEQGFHGKHNVNKLSAKSCPERIVLEDLDLVPVEKPEIDKWAQTLANTVFPATEEAGNGEARSEFCERFLLVSDTVFAFLAQNAMDIRSRIRIDPGTGVVDKGALWTEENLPPACILWGVYSIAPSYAKPAPSQEELAAALPDKQLLQLGGNAGTGSGLVQIYFDTVSAAAAGA